MRYPFISGKFVTGPHFCGRGKEIRDLTSHIVSNGRACLIGERKIGKSSLIHECVRRTKKLKILYIDLWTVRSVDDVCRKMLQGLVGFESRQSFIFKLLKMFSYLRPSLTFDPQTGHPNLSLSSDAPKMTQKSLEELLDLIGEMKNAVVVFDEFQDAGLIPESEKVLATIRSKIQSHDNIPYIFSGSIRNKMLEIFTNYHSPFYKTAICMNIPPIERVLFQKHIKNLFKNSGNRTVKKDILNHIFDICYDIPGDIQQLCIHIWLGTDENSEIQNENIHGALEELLSILRGSFENIYGSLSNQQMLLAKAISNTTEGKSNISKNILVSSGIRLTQSAQKAANKLVEKKIFVKNESIYRFSDPFFKEWIKTIH